MKTFMGKNFLLTTDTAKELFHDYAENMPIIDYHCHINPKEIYEDRKFENITQVWLGGDHYKWRQMRSNGIDEKYITGDATDREKFQKWAETLEKAIGNPLYHPHRPLPSCMHRPEEAISEKILSLQSASRSMSVPCPMRTHQLGFYLLWQAKNDLIHEKLQLH